LDVMKMCKINTLNEPLMKGVIASLLLALDFLHSHHIIHRVPHTPLLLWCIL
jgi:serine/threonine protein kinase